MKFIVIAAVLLLAPAHAGADCAWVLWRETSRGGAPVEWYPDGYATSKACYDELNGREKAMRKAGWYIAGAPNLFMHKNSSTATRLRCLPDTVDPRGAKSK
jgi:hypothetical protein